MKINDVVNEGPLDFAKKVGAGIKGAVSGLGTGPRSAVVGGAQAMQRSQQQTDMAAHAKRMMPYWQKKAQALAASGEDMADVSKYQQYFQDWMTKEGFPGGKDFSAIGNLKSTNPLDVQEYLTKAVAMDSSGIAKPKSAPVVTPTNTPKKTSQMGAWKQQQSTTPTAQQTAAPTAQQTAAPTAQQTPTPTPKFNNPQQVVDTMLKSLPPDWLPTITAELLKRQKVGATPK